MKSSELEIILKHIQDRVLSVKDSISQDMDRRNEFLTEKVTNAITKDVREQLKELFVEEIKPLKKQANDNANDIIFVKRLVGYSGTALAGIGSIIAWLGGLFK